MGCSHVTSRIDASDFLSEVDSFLYRVVTKQLSRRIAESVEGNYRTFMRGKTEKFRFEAPGDTLRNFEQANPL